MNCAQILTKHLLFARCCGRHSFLVRKGDFAAIQERKDAGVTDERQRTQLGGINKVGLVGVGDGLNLEW